MKNVNEVLLDIFLKKKRICLSFTPTPKIHLSFELAPDQSYFRNGFLGQIMFNLVYKTVFSIGYFSCNFVGVLLNTKQKQELRKLVTYLAKTTFA